MYNFANEYQKEISKNSKSLIPITMLVIKNIIFDFGGIIINISHHKVENAFKLLGVDNFELLFNQVNQSKLFQQFEKGEISSTDFRKEIRNLTNLNISDKNLDSAWNMIIENYPPERINLLKQIKENYRIFILSNTNEIHYNFYTPKFEKEFGYSFESLFEKTYWSFKFGERKPDLTSYNRVLMENNLNPSETLFIDDSVQNIRAAQKVGINSVHLTGDVDITDLFQNGIFDKTFLFNQS